MESNQLKFFVREFERLADDDIRSGMCKAGFAGDDAPRAVFRKFYKLDLSD